MDHFTTTIPLCGVRITLTFVLLGMIFLILAIILPFFRKKISKFLFLATELCIVLIALLYSFQYEFEECGSYISASTRYEFIVFPKNIFPIKISEL